MELQKLLAEEKQKFDLLIEQMKLEERMHKNETIRQSKEVM